MQQHVKKVEHDVLIRCLRPVTTTSTVEELKLLLAKVTDWQGLKKIALDHLVFSSLYRQLADNCPQEVPANFLNELHHLYKRHVSTNLVKTAELTQILTLLQSHDIITVAYKGPVLAQVAYGDIAYRQFTDLDILVIRRDIDKVKHLLLSQGYTLRYSFTKKQKRLHLKHGVEFTFEHSRRTMLDVHWRFAADYLGGGLDPEEAIGRRVPIQILGKTVYTLHPVDSLLMLCQHGTFHFWSTLSTVSDVAHLIHSQNSWDWPAVLERAKTFGLWRQSLLGLSLAQEWLGAQVPSAIIREAEADPAVVSVRRTVSKNLWSRRGDDIGFLEQTALYLQTRDCFKDKFLHVWFRLAIPTVEDWRWVPLPDSFFWLYYGLRPLRLGLEGLVLSLR